MYGAVGQRRRAVSKFTDILPTIPSKMQADSATFSHVGPGGRSLPNIIASLPARVERKLVRQSADTAAKGKYYGGSSFAAYAQHTPGLEMDMVVLDA